MSKNDAAIKDLLQKVEDQKQGLGKKEKVSWLTNGVFKWDDTRYFNINTVTDATVMADALGFLITREGSFKEACKRLGCKGEFKWNGYAIDDWEEDFKTRIRCIDYDKKKKLLDDTKAKLGGLVSEEARTEMELEDIRKILA